MGIKQTLIESREALIVKYEDAKVRCQSIGKKPYNSLSKDQINEYYSLRDSIKKMYRDINIIGCEINLLNGNNNIKLYY